MALTVTLALALAPNPSPNPNPNPNPNLHVQDLGAREARVDEVVPERSAAPVQQAEQAELRGLRTQVIVVQRLVAHTVEAHVGARPMLGRPAGRIAAERTGALGRLLLELPLALHLVRVRVRVRLG